MIQKVEKIILNYFSGFTHKDLAKVTKDFDANISLKDWNFEWHGVGDVTSAIKEIFDSVKTIVISPKQFLYDENEEYVTCLIDIFIENLDSTKTILSVVDIISLDYKYGDDEGVKIISIDAYKQ